MLEWHQLLIQHNWQGWYSFLMVVQKIPMLKEISQQAFIKLANDLDINITPENLVDVVSQPPLSNLLEPMDPNTGVLVFKGAGQPNVAMPVNKAQDIVAAAAKSAASKDRGV